MELTNTARLVGQWSPALFYLPVPTLRLHTSTTGTHLLTWVQESQINILMIAWKTLTTEAPPWGIKAVFIKDQVTDRVKQLAFG